MTDDRPPNPALLPAGLRDLLPLDAETEASAVEALMTVFAAHGYQRVKPPLLAFEDSLLARSGAAVADQTFRRRWCPRYWTNRATPVDRAALDHKDAASRMPTIAGTRPIVVDAATEEHGTPAAQPSKETHGALPLLIANQ
ncbi:hypothetical protein CCS01_25125 [Rhodopila globiformis]|uniref:Class II Histidinyl-tRNA synthetase (HisRS)-like catalytic core domain-containing protein n=1 Tax=Rhodopila globiformis TaxID=1071 RepID=A0A2S6N0K4_RHOGL|nr:hypothetical protein CCS01_25125 [Rhodopila globiformis]